MVVVGNILMISKKVVLDYEKFVFFGRICHVGEKLFYFCSWLSWLCSDCTVVDCNALELTVSLLRLYS